MSKLVVTLDIESKTVDIETARMIVAGYISETNGQALLDGLMDYESISPYNPETNQGDLDLTIVRTHVRIDSATPAPSIPDRAPVTLDADMADAVAEEIDSSFDMARKGGDFDNLLYLQDLRDIYGALGGDVEDMNGHIVQLAMGDFDAYNLGMATEDDMDDLQALADAVAEAGGDNSVMLAKIAATRAVLTADAPSTVD